MNSKKRVKKHKTILFSCCFLFFFLTASTAVSLATQPDPVESSLVSPALCVLSEQNPMAMAALSGTPIAFDKDDFARSMNLSRIEQITVTQIPPVTDGELRLGNTVLNNGATIAEKDLSLLSYHSSVATDSSFRFCVGNSPYEITCHLYHLDQINASPTLSMVPKTSLNVTTHRNVTLYGTLSCHDPDGDPTIIEIVSYPEKGLLILEDPAQGTYTFTPTADFTGKDSFSYVARDVYGNYSAAATVNLTISMPSSSVVYRDILNQPCYNAALIMTEEGIMTGKHLGLDSYFEPDREVTRGEFTVMAMRAMGMYEVSDKKETVFSDNAEIDASQKGYIATAYELGYVKGLYRDGVLCFEPNRSITRAEAAVMLGNMLDAATPTFSPVFQDADAVPSWAATSLSELTAMGILETEEGRIDAIAPLTRSDAAQILFNMMRAME